MMKRKNKWIVPVAVIAFVAIFVFIANNMADKPVVYAKGNIVLDDALIEKAGVFSTMFIVVYDADNPMPMPYGAIRERIRPPHQKEVAPLIITPSKLEVMRPGSPFPMNIRIKVRLDRDGQGGPDQPGDLVGQIERIAAGSEDVKLVISQEIKG